MKLLTSDLHVDDNPANEYRWRVFDEIHNACSKYECTEIVIAGDLSDRKDRHSSILVNRLVDTFTRLTRSGIMCLLIPGNHDIPLEGPPYWTFLRTIPRVQFYTEPTMYKGALLLPHTPRPDRDWAQLPELFSRTPDGIILHQLLNGACVHGRETKGYKLPAFFERAKHVWAGDVHDPQRVGCAEYIGAPHPVAFGDNHKCRMVLVDDSWGLAEEIILHPPKKEIITIRSFADLRKVRLQEGDQVRVRVELEAAKAGDWPELARRIAKWAEQKGAHLASTEALLTATEGNTTEVQSWSDPKKVLAAYMAEQGVKDTLADTGNEILNLALKEEVKSGHIRVEQAGSLDFRIESVMLSNFCSYSDEQTITLPNTPGLRLMTGVNEAQPELGPNGSGKTSFFEAISFALFGHSSDGMRGSDLTKEGESRSEVCVVVRLGEEHVTIRRKSNPNNLTVNGNPASQETITSLLRLTDDQFYETMLFGQGHPQFFDMSLGDRDKFMNTVLQLDLWQKASDLTGAKIKSLSSDIAKLEISLSSTTGGLAEVDESHESELRLKSRQHRVEVWNRLEKAKLVIEQQQKVVDEEERGLKAAQAELNKLDARRHKALDFGPINTMTSEIRVIEQDLKRLGVDREFYTDNADCPTCHQEITELFRNTQLEQLSNQIHILDKSRKDKARSLVEMREAYEKEQAIAREREVTISKANTLVAVCQQKVHSAKDKLRTYQDASQSIKDAQDPYAELIKKMIERRVALHQAKKDLESRIDTLKGQIILYQFWVQGFKRVRVFIAGRLLTILSIETKTALGLLGLTEWNIEFRQEVLTSRSGIYVIVSDGQGVRARRSGGETQRLRLAVSLGISNLIQRMTGLSCKFEVWDEPGTYLSNSGVENLFDVLAYRAKTMSKCIWIVEHRAIENPSIIEQWIARKTKEHGSVIEMLRGET